MDIIRIYGIYYALTEGVAKALVAILYPKKNAALPMDYSMQPLIDRFTCFLNCRYIMANSQPSAPFIFGALLSLLASFLMIIWVK